MRFSAFLVARTRVRLWAAGVGVVSVLRSGGVFGCSGCRGWEEACRWDWASGSGIEVWGFCLRDVLIPLVAGLYARLEA